MADLNVYIWYNPLLDELSEADFFVKVIMERYVKCNGEFGINIWERICLL